MSSAFVAAIALLLAQQGGMPDLHALSGRPIPVAELPPGTVSVRVSNQLPMNGVPDVEVTALTRTTAGEMRKRTAKTGADGRTQFESIPAGATFQAEATVSGEKLTSAPFPVPSQGGTRIMLIAGLGAAPAQAEPAFTLGAVAGKVDPADDLPA